MLTKQTLCYPLLGFLLTLLLAGCAPPTLVDAPDSPAEETTVPVEVTATPEVLADCFQSATAVAWLDENGDGVRDAGERPLAGIEFVLEPTAYSRTTSDENGIAAILATTPGDHCQEPLQISAVGYEGYTLTTPGTMADIDPEQEYAFGFQPESAADLPAADSPSDIFVVGAEGLDLSPKWEVKSVNYLFTWIGEAPPAYEYEQIVAANGRFQHSNGSDVTQQVEQLLASLNSLTPTDKVRYTNLWTDDYPEWFVEIAFADGRSLLVYSESTGFRGHAPWYVQADGQLYRQTNGDIGFALYDLLSEDMQDYFTLDEPPFDEALLDPGARSTIYYRGSDFSGLLPLATNLTYGLDLASSSLRGVFILQNDKEWETSTHPVASVAQMQMTLPDGQIQLCTLTPEEEEEYQITRWYFDCPLPADVLPISLPAEIQLETVTDQLLTSYGQINLSMADIEE